MALEIIEKAIELAKKQQLRAIDNLMRLQAEFSYDEFKTLFKVRAELAMIEHRTPGRFAIDKDNEGVLQLMYHYLIRKNESINPNIGMILTGKYGCGKSITISAFCKVFSDLYPDQEVEEIHAIALSEAIKLNGVMPFARKNLLIQDLGKEENIINAYGTKMNPIGNLLAIRAEYGALTFGSTNMKWSSLDNHYTDYITNRMKEHVTFLLLPGDSRRKDFTRI